LLKLGVVALENKLILYFYKIFSLCVNICEKDVPNKSGRGPKSIIPIQKYYV